MGHSMRGQIASFGKGAFPVGSNVVYGRRNGWREVTEHISFDGFRVSIPSFLSFVSMRK